MRQHLQHNLSYHPLYHTWENIRSRCNNSKNNNYKHYGGRGIKVCKRWDNFANFLHDVGEKPTPKHTLDRIDNDGDYEPNNVRWATQVLQIYNSRVRSTNKSGIKGVWFNKKVGNYQVSLRINGKRLYLGSFYSFEDAKNARLNAEKMLSEGLDD